ncbi:universal stress protein [Desulfobulbus alkaliphilus]|uniref:universal stress protein n=1 Tax=Desulfobulbus alkaliphilus TaxID=869814 RepID=UPI001965BB5E|nr:universal stress protein [Desulfobulbus alkaliphilus]MBM9537668.1 universal stress protein [Desulfobulbus alkaliphilus]
MQDIQQIVVPVDFHQHTDDLADFAVGIAGKLGAKITFVHVIEEVVHYAYSEYNPITFSDIEKELREIADKKMTAFLDRIKATCPDCSSEVLAGNIADSIVGYASDKNAGMIVMATHGAQGIEKVFLGSVAERVIKRAHCPTLVFNPYKGERGYKIDAPVLEKILPM